MAKDGLADRTRLHLHRVVSTMLKHAAQWGAVARNVATMVDAPRVKASELEILTPEQLRAALASLRSPELDPIADVALGSGLRRGELLALRWQDVDFDGATLRVEQAVEQTKRGGTILKAPKTRHGRRAVSLAPATVAVLREHWRAQQETRLALGLGKAPRDGFVFANWDGAIRSPHWLTQAVAQGDGGGRPQGDVPQPSPYPCVHPDRLRARRVDNQPPPRPWGSGHHARGLRPPVPARRPRRRDHGGGAQGDGVAAVANRWPKTPTSKC